MANNFDDLVAANRILAREKVLDGYGHISVRDFDNPRQYFISRSLAPELVTAGDIVALDVTSSSPVASSDQPLYLERFIHGSIYKARPDVKAGRAHPFTLRNSVRDCLQCPDATGLSHERLPSPRGADLRNPQ